MRIGPKYKLARRLGAPIFEKTQTQKFAASESKKSKSKTFSRPRSDFGIQMLEKQKARFSYGIAEKQLANYVKKAFADKRPQKAQVLFEGLEKRLDNTVYRAGLAPTRQAARQLVSHGHIKVNGKKITIPSHQIKNTDKITVKESSAAKGPFVNLKEQTKTYTAPSWLKSDINKMEVTIQGEPKLEQQELLFDLEAVLEFYRDS